jgi:hypothetical protein
LHLKFEDKSMPGSNIKHHLNLPAEVLITANSVNNFVKYWILLNCHCILTVKVFIAIHWCFRVQIILNPTPSIPPKKNGKKNQPVMTLSVWSFLRF